MPGEKRIEIIVPEDQLANKLNDAIQIIAKLRHHQKLWYQHYGSQHRRNLATWEDKADMFLAELTIETKENNQL